jgi:hypothetical protein
MEIKIINVSKSNYWYKDKIGTKYKVLHESPYYVQVFRFRQLFNSTSYIVFRGDYEILNFKGCKEGRACEQRRSASD